MTRQIRAKPLSFSTSAWVSDVYCHAPVSRLVNSGGTIATNQMQAVKSFIGVLHVVFYSRIEVKDYVTIVRFVTTKDGNVLWNEYVLDKFDHEAIFKTRFTDRLSGIERQGFVGSWKMSAGVVFVPSSALQNIQGGMNAVFSRLAFETVGEKKWLISAPITLTSTGELENASMVNHTTLRTIEINLDNI